MLRLLSLLSLYVNDLILDAITKKFLLLTLITIISTIALIMSI